MTLGLLLGASGAAWGQASTRAEEIELARREKAARLWPETEPTLVQVFNSFLERGGKEEAGRGGANGFQPLVLGGMRSGNGMTLGVGYKRSDIFRDAVAFRVTARGTFEKAYMFDFHVDVPKLRSEYTFLDLYSKYENSPQMDYYGPGTDSDKDDRTSYRLETTDVLGRLGFEVYRNLRVGGGGGYLHVNTGPGQRSGVPSTEQVFGPDTTPGIDVQTSFTRMGGFAEFDYRDHPGAATSGGRYFVLGIYNWDRRLERHSHWQIDWALEQHIPWANKQRTLALRLGGTMTLTANEQTVPFYRQPTLGGNEWLRGFARYRFHDNNRWIFTAEHRWNIFAGARGVLFFEAGKVARRASDFQLNDLKVSGGFGLRFKFEDSIFMRTDFAVSEEGARFMWTFNRVF
jgi:outer membrane protein assembly factor BamA